MQFIRAIVRHGLSDKKLSSLFLFSIFIEVLYAVAAPLSLKYLVDEAFVPKNVQAFVVILSILIGGGLLQIAASAYGDYSLGKLSGNLISRMRTELFSHVQKQSLSFFQRFRAGDLSTRLSADMAAMERAIRGSCPFFLKETCAIALGLAMLFSIEWKLTLAMLAGSVLMFVGPKLLQARAESANQNFKEAQERFANSIDEMVKGHKTIKSLHLQPRLAERARKQIQDLFSFGLKLHMVNALMERLPLTALLVLNGTMMGFGGYLIFHDEMTVGGFMAFFTLFMSVGQSSSSLSLLIPNIIDANVSFKRIEEIVSIEPAVTESAQPVTLPSVFSFIRMDRVTFGYNDEANQLKDVSLSIAAGSYVAFVGPSGSGKSTALQLLSRFYDPKEGFVAIDDVNLRNASEASLRSVATLVTQDTFLFHATIRDNLLPDGAEATDDDMFEAAKRAKIHDVIVGWPDGYDTWIHHEGGSLSGGERQRISLARALLRKPKVLLLDEVTSALDPATEEEMNGLIHQLRGRQTIVSVTHRLASAVNADLIYVFKDGQVVETGTHQELLQQGGLYRSLWEKQHGFQLSLDGDGLLAAVDADRLARLPFFQGIEPALLHDIASLFATETCQAGETIMREGEDGNKFYIIVRGKFEVLKKDGERGEKCVAVLQDGDHFGEIALLRNIPRTASIKATGHAVLLSVRREAFHRLTAAHPHIRSSLERTLLERI